MTTLAVASLTCERCLRPAVLKTPHGLFCTDHTLEVMDTDPTLWMPWAIDKPVPAAK
jgi:hypothetical protein